MKIDVNKIRNTNDLYLSMLEEYLENILYSVISEVAISGKNTVYLI